MLVVKDARAQHTCVSVDLARELGQRLGVAIDLITLTAAGKVLEAVTDAQVNTAFVAIDAVRVGIACPCAHGRPHGSVGKMDDDEAIKDF